MLMKLFSLLSTWNFVPRTEEFNGHAEVVERDYRILNTIHKSVQPGTALTQQLSRKSRRGLATGLVFPALQT